MFRFSLLLFGALFIGTLFSRDFHVGEAYAYHNGVNLTYEDKVLNCRLENRGGPMVYEEECHMFLYINNKPVSDIAGIVISHKHTALLQATARCDAACLNDENIVPMDLEINKMIFIGMCVGAAVVFVLLIIAIVCGVRHWRGNYKKLPQDNQDTDSLEKAPAAGSTC